MEQITVGDLTLQLLPQRAVYIEALRILLVADVHLGKSETFQHYGIPVPSLVNQTTLDRLQSLCCHYQPDKLWILGDLFHSHHGLIDSVIETWLRFLEHTQVPVQLILGNHDRHLQDRLSSLSVQCFFEVVETQGLILSHEPCALTDQHKLNLCGHIHPCIRLAGGGDRLRLPCFFWEPQPGRLTLPAFGEFTGGYEIRLAAGAIAYSIAEDQVIPIRSPIRG